MGVAVAMVQSGGGEAHAMSSYKWKNRPLLVFAPTPGDARLQRQLRIVRGNAGGLRQRDMVVAVITGGRGTRGGVMMALGRGQSLSAAALRRRFGISPDAFRVILIGKDGGTKLSSAQPIGTGQLFQTIDAMPMRRDEIRRRGQ